MTPDATRARITKARPRPAVECTVAISATTWNCASCIREGSWRERLRQEVAQDPFRSLPRHCNGDDGQRRGKLGECLTTHAAGRRRLGRVGGDDQEIKVAMTRRYGRGQRAALGAGA